MAFSDPISTAQPGYYVKTNPIVSPYSWFGPAITAPYPTNAWFMDFVITPNSDEPSSNTDRRLTAWPYSIRARSNGLDVNKPFMRLYPDNRTLRNEHQINYDATATNYGWTSDSDPQIWRYLDLSLLSTETIATQYLKSFDQLSATLRWNVDTTHYMEAPVVRGMPYATMRYTALTPVIQTANTDYHSIATVNGSAPSGTFTGTKFTLTVNRPYLGSGATETWIVYTSASITFTATNAGLTASAPFTGYVRLAVVADGTGTLSMLDTYKDAVPIGGTTNVVVTGDTQTTTFTYTTVGTSSTPIIYSLPHHEALLVSPSYVPNHTFSTIRGTLHAVIGSSWTLTDNLSTVTWNSPNAIDSGKLPAIATALASEKTFAASNLNAVEAYTFGKQIARAARLVLIADQTGDTTSRDSILTTMKPYINQWLTNSANTTTTLSLAYDSTWGGIVSNNALVTTPPGNPNQATEFGNAVYNDHYFHWGYFIYAAAVIAKYDSSWMSTYQSKVNDIIRDIANPSPSGDTYFPQLRHYDWYEGHSWASGLQANGDGRNQESTSESTNAWYGINLWGLITGQANIRSIGRFLQAAEVRGAHTYWQMPISNGVYPAAYNAQKVLGIVFTNKVFNATWFGLGDDQIAGIQSLPFTPATHELLPKQYMSEMYPVRLAPLASTSAASLPGGWLGNTYGALAIIDPSTAFNDISALATSTTQTSEYIDAQGGSKTNMLWWSAVQGTSTSTPSTTTTTMVITPTSSAAYGATVTMYATVSPSSATGTVYFSDGGTQLGSAPVSSGSASFAVSTLGSGSHTITATFTSSNASAYSSSTSAGASYTITGGASTATATATTLTASPSTTAVSGASALFTATISPSTAPGTVTFYDGNTSLGVVSVANGVATISSTTLTVGAHSMSATFAPTSTTMYTNSNSSLTYTITSSSGGGTSSTPSNSNANAVPYIAFASGQPQTRVRNGVADTNYTIASSDTIVAFTSLTATRTVILPSASANIGRTIIIKDETGSCSSAIQIVVNGTIDGATNVALASAYASIRIYAGSTGWFKISA